MTFLYGFGPGNFHSFPSPCVMLVQLRSADPALLEHPQLTEESWNARLSEGFTTPLQLRLRLPAPGCVNPAGSLQSHSARGPAGLAGSPCQGKALEEEFSGAPSSWLVLAHFACIHFALRIFNNYDRKAYIETKELRYDGGISLQIFVFV